MMLSNPLQTYSDRIANGGNGRAPCGGLPAGIGVERSHGQFVKMRVMRPVERVGRLPRVIGTASERD